MISSIRVSDLNGGMGTLFAINPPGLRAPAHRRARFFMVANIWHLIQDVAATLGSPSPLRVCVRTAWWRQSGSASILLDETNQSRANIDKGGAHEAHRDHFGRSCTDDGQRERDRA
jgi:hypothetical protein